jgi:hypothetical protein
MSFRNQVLEERNLASVALQSLPACRCCGSQYCPPSIPKRRKGENPHEKEEREIKTKKKTYYNISHFEISFPHGRKLQILRFFRLWRQLSKQYFPATVLYILPC